MAAEKSSSADKTENLVRRQRILDAAESLTLHYGYDKTTVSDIAREAGVSKGAIYLHFDSKETLFEALLEREIWRYGSIWLELMEKHEGSWSMVTSFKLALTAVNQSPLMQAIMRRDQRILGSFLRYNSPMLQQKFSTNTELYHLLQQVGAARQDIAPELIAYFFNLVAYGLILSEPEDNAPPFEDVIEAIGLILDRGLAPENGGNPEAAREIIHSLVSSMRAQRNYPDQ